MTDSRWPHLANAQDIIQWADRIEARSELPRLVRTLIRQTNDQVIHLDMPAGEGIDAGGYDGIVRAIKATPLVPSGNSVWEMGAGGNPLTKANDDYRDRTKDPRGIDPSQTTFVFVTPRRWEKRRAWASEKHAAGVWKDVHAFDVDDLEQALEAAPAAHIWFSERISKPGTGVRTIENWWSRFSELSSPTLTPEIILAGRSDQAAVLLRFLERESQVTSVSAPSTDDVLAFVAAAMLTTPEKTKDDLLSRTFIVSDTTSLRYLDGFSGRLILLPFNEELRREARLVTSHHVLMLGSDEIPGDINLPPIDRAEFIKFLKSSGIDDVKCEALAGAVRRSLIAFQGSAPAHGSSPRTEWAGFLGMKAVRRAWLAGGWVERRSGDMEVLAILVGDDYNNVRDTFRGASQGPDPLLSLDAGTWTAISREESWEIVGPKLGPGDLDSLEAAVQVVLGAVAPTLELESYACWKSSIFGNMRLHSSDLREGIAGTLALMGSKGNSLRIGQGSSISDWADSVVFRLLERANNDETAQLWSSLSDVLPLLAEASPEIFLRAVDKGVGGKVPLFTKLFADNSNTISVNSPHTQLLWALEELAWSSDHFAFAVEALAGLCEIDPGGRLSNRPLASMIAAFRPWSPQTTSSLAKRIAVIDSLESRHPKVTWSLLCGLVPQMHQVGFYSAAPKFRTWKPKDPPPVSHQEFFEMCKWVTLRLITMAANEPNRWPALIQRLEDFTTAERAVALDHLELICKPKMSGPDLRAELWNEITELARKHREHTDTPWAMPIVDVERLEQIAALIAPEDIVLTRRWLFDSQLPELGTGTHIDNPKYDADLSQVREESVRSIYQEKGFDDLVRLTEIVSESWSVGVAIANCQLPVGALLLEFLDDENRKKVEMAYAFVTRQTELRGLQWTIATAKEFQSRPHIQARLLRSIRELEKAWPLLEQLNSDANDYYWSEFVVYGRGQDFALANETASHLLQHGRPGAALEMLLLYRKGDAHPSNPELVARCLDEILEAANDVDDDSEIRRLSDYQLNAALNYIRNSDLDEERLVSLEWRLLPSIGYEAQSQTLQRRLSRDPSFFVDVISLCYRSKSESVGDSTPIEGTTSLASNSWRLLHAWNLIPGSGETGSDFDEAGLMSWVSEARSLLTKADRLDVGDIHIGQILARSVEDPDGTWPSLPIRKVIERVANNSLEDGFRTGTFNMRGVTSRIPTDGGDQERVLVSKFRTYAGLIRDSSPRTSATLMKIADGYEADARQWDERADEFRREILR